jgi:hypothetical protein
MRLRGLKGTPGLHRGRGGLSGLAEGQGDGGKVVAKLPKAPIKLLALVLKRDFHPFTLVIGEVREQLDTRS